MDQLINIYIQKIKIAVVASNNLKMNILSGDLQRYCPVCYIIFQPALEKQQEFEICKKCQEKNNEAIQILLNVIITAYVNIIHMELPTNVSWE